MFTCVFVAVTCLCLHMCVYHVCLCVMCLCMYVCVCMCFVYALCLCLYMYVCCVLYVCLVYMFAYVCMRLYRRWGVITWAGKASSTSGEFKGRRERCTSPVRQLLRLEPTYKTSKSFPIPAFEAPPRWWLQRDQSQTGAVLLLVLPLLSPPHLSLLRCSLYGILSPAQVTTGFLCQ